MKDIFSIHFSRKPILPTDPKKEVRLSCRVDDRTRERLFNVAAKYKRRPSLLIRHAVEMLLDIVEEQESAPPKRIRKGARGS